MSLWRDYGFARKDSSSLISLPSFQIRLAILCFPFHPPPLSVSFSPSPPTCSGIEERCLVVPRHGNILSPCTQNTKFTPFIPISPSIGMGYNLGCSESRKDDSLRIAPILSPGCVPALTNPRAAVARETDSDHLGCFLIGQRGKTLREPDSPSNKRLNRKEGKP